MRPFTTLTALLLLLLFSVAATTPLKRIYVCTPCGLSCDATEYDHPGTCPVCGMPLVDKSAAAAAISPEILQSPLIGTWAGAYNGNAIDLHITSRAEALTGTVDFVGIDGGIPLKDVHFAGDHLQGVFAWRGATVSVDAAVANATMNGNATVDGRAYALRAIRLAQQPIAAIRPFEGLYRAGGVTYLIEVLNAQFGITFVELPSGTIRNVFQIAPNEFIAGPTLLAAQPEEWRLTFPEPGKLVVRKAAGEITATRLPLPTEEVTFQNGAVRLAGTLILPIGGGPHPAIVFMHGSGQTPRTSNLGLGFLLASQGIAVLKYDKRGSGESTTTNQPLRYEDLADDAIAGARMLQARSDIDPARVGFWGISEGAWTATLAGARMPGTAFVVAVAGGGMSPAVGELEDTEDQLRSDGRFSEPQIREALDFERARDRYMHTGEGWDAYAKARESAVKQTWYGYPTTDLFGPKDPQSPFWSAKAQSYFYDPLPALRAIRCPFLAVAGEFDSWAGNEKAMRAALRSSNDVTIAHLPHGNHDLFETRSGNASELPQTKRYVPEFFPLMTEWLESRLKLR